MVGFESVDGAQRDADAISGAKLPLSTEEREEYEILAVIHAIPVDQRDKLLAQLRAVFCPAQDTL